MFNQDTNYDWEQWAKNDKQFMNMHAMTGIY